MSYECTSPTGCINMKHGGKGCGLSGCEHRARPNMDKIAAAMKRQEAKICKLEIELRNVRFKLKETEEVVRVLTGSKR